MRTGTRSPTTPRRASRFEVLVRRRWGRSRGEAAQAQHVGRARHRERHPEGEVALAGREDVEERDRDERARHPHELEAGLEPGEVATPQVLRTVALQERVERDPAELRGHRDGERDDERRRVLQTELRQAKEILAQVKEELNKEGIPYDKQTKVFDMFYRASKNSQGSGLGLYICLEIVKKLGGHIALQSEPGQGTKFTLTLPNHTPQE